MRYVEIRRHTMRVKPGQNLSQEGVTLARRVGEGLGPFDLVVTSTIPRAFQTAIAMGFAVQREIEAFSIMSDHVDAEVSWPASFAAYAKAVKKGGATAKFARDQAQILTEIAQSLLENGRALVVSHGGIVELGIIGCLPNEDYQAYGAHCNFCEGARLYFDGQKFIRAELLRVKK